MKNIYFFDQGCKEMRELLGGKGANLAEMTKMGFAVPQGFTITTKVCLDFLKNKKVFPSYLKAELASAVKQLENKSGKKFSDLENPLLVSVRSGAVVSMPGMMDTVLNLGLNDQTVEFLAQKTGNRRFALDSYRRFIQMFSDVVMRVSSEKFEDIIKAKKEQKKVQNDTDLLSQDWEEIIIKFKEIVLQETGQSFPVEPLEQLEKSIEAVFNSWEIPRAKKYRQINKISDSLGTAVNIQEMVFGNLGNTSGTGVCFSRNPINGKKKLFGDFLLNAQGEDVVAGIRIPREIEQLQNEMPQVFQQLQETAEKLEQHFKEMQDIEFTIENGKFFLLQTRTGKRTASSSVKIAVDMHQEGLISKEEALLRLDANCLDQLLHPHLDPSSKKNILTKGVPASPGAACGQVVFTASDAVRFTEEGKKVILVRHETSPEDISGMHVAEGILTACGGKASHAAVVARGMGTPCVAGAGEIIVNPKAKKFTVKDTVVQEGDVITLDGVTGEVILGTCKTIEAKLSEELSTILTWADQIRSLKVRANADTPLDAKKAREFGAEGIGLCRTEHMFFEHDRIDIIREMILASSLEERKKALDKLLPLQQKDFEEIFIVMDDLPVTIRFLDPPLHEFLPQRNQDIEKFANTFNLTFEQAKDRIKNLQEVNPMLGHRGCRLFITFPEILKMQVKSILHAAIKVKKQGIKIFPEMMIPLVGTLREFKFLKKIILNTVEQIFAEEQEKIDFQIGTMIELPRACMMTDKIVLEADFFSFGTNDLTQMTFGFSRDDVARFLPEYLNLKILENDPFESLDKAGVGNLISFAVKKARSVKDIKISVCGEHGGDPSSIEFFQQENFNTISCSPFRVPIARLAAAQAVLKQSRA